MQRSSWLVCASLALTLGCASEAVEEPIVGNPGAGAGEPSESSSSGSTTSGGGTTKPASYPVPDWPEGDPADHGLDADQLDAAALVAEQNDSYCLLVIRHGVLVAEHYWQGHDRDTAQTSWSIAKSYSATLVGIAIDNGEIGSLDDSVADYIPEWKGSEREAITIRHLVTMTSGLSWSLFSDYVGMASLSQNHSQHAIDLAADVDPGSEWTYHNGGVQLLEPVFRAATGQTIEQYAETHLWSKLGMTATWAHDPSENPTAYASVLTSCRDHARLGYLYLHRGTWAEGEQVVASSFVEDAIKPSQLHNRAYGYLWWLNGETPAVNAMMEPYDGRMVPFAPHDLFAARGFGNQFIDVIPSLDMVVVRFGADPMNNFDIGELLEDSRFGKHDAILQPVLDAVED